MKGCNSYGLSFDLSKNVEYWSYQRRFLTHYRSSRHTAVQLSRVTPEANKE